MVGFDPGQRHAALALRTARSRDRNERGFGARKDVRHVMLHTDRGAVTCSSETNRMAKKQDCAPPNQPLINIAHISGELAAGSIKEFGPHLVHPKA